MSVTLPSAVALPPSLQAVLVTAVAELVQEVVRGELASALPRNAPPASPWMTPPAASRVTGVPVKTIRRWVRDGRITMRLKNLSSDPKQKKFLVNAEEVAGVAEGGRDGSPPSSGQLAVAERARQILAARAAKGR